MTKPPIGYRPLAWLGAIANIIALIFWVVSIVVTTILDNSISSDSENLLKLSAIDYFLYLLSIPLSITGIIISYQLITKNIAALNYIKGFFSVSIFIDLSGAISEFKFNLSTAENSFSELAFSSLEILITAALLNYWDRPQVREYLILCSNRRNK